MKVIQMSMSLAHSATSVPEAACNEIVIVRRDEIPTLTQVVVNGEQHSLGILKDLRRHPALARFLPEAARLSVAWVRLQRDEVLATHDHPTASMIVMCSGSARVVGDIEATLHSGDIIAIPPGCSHGFIGAGDDGHWGLSIQFEGSGLYENPEQSRVAFVAGQPNRNMQRLLERNDQRAVAHKDNALFGFVHSAQIHDQARRFGLLDCIQVWSDCFHRILLARSATTEPGALLDIFEQHLDEEFSHNADLARSRGASLKPVWDPVLDACSHWFIWKMLSLDARAKLVLVHMVLEVGAAVFHEIANPILSPYRETGYFEQHDEADPHHRMMGLELLAEIDDTTYAELLQVHEEGWDMLETLCARMAEIASRG